MRRCQSTVRRNSSVAGVALKMFNERLRELPVVDSNGALLGIVRADDLFKIDIDTIEQQIKPVHLVMPKETSSMEAVRMMSEAHEDSAFVVDGRKVVGTFSWRDVVENFAD